MGLCLPAQSVCSLYHSNVPLDHGTYPYLHCTYMHYSVCLCSCLVPYSCAVPSNYIPLTCSSLTHLPLSNTTQLPHLVCFLIPIHVSLILCFYLHLFFIFNIFIYSPIALWLWDCFLLFYFTSLLMLK